jgi:hypothetical protein
VRGAVEHDWGNDGYRAVDIDGDGTLEFQIGDDRFAYVFTDFADSYFPLQIWNLQDGRLVQTTRSFAGAIRADARTLKAAYIRSRRVGDVRGVLAAYVADEALLGNIDDGWDPGGGSSCAGRARSRNWWSIRRGVHQGSPAIP